MSDPSSTFGDMGRKPSPVKYNRYWCKINGNCLSYIYILNVYTMIWRYTYKNSSKSLKYIFKLYFEWFVEYLKFYYHWYNLINDLTSKLFLKIIRYILRIVIPKLWLLIINCLIIYKVSVLRTRVRANYWAGQGEMRCMVI